MTVADLRAFRSEDMQRRLLCGGLPSFFLAEQDPEGDFQDRLNSFWAEVDFVISQRGQPPIAIECKWRAAHADLRISRGAEHLGRA